MAATALLGSLAIALVPTAAGHDGTAHAATPHWVLLGALLLGIGVLGTSVRFGRTRWTARPRFVATGLFVGALFVLFGAIGLVETQFEPLATNPVPVPRWIYPTVAFSAGIAIVLASVLLGLRRWAGRPAYIALGTCLGLWVAYPVLLPRASYWHPLGYLLVLGVPLLVGLIVRETAWPVLSRADRRARAIGLGAAALFVVFFLFSTGQLTTNPETGVNLPADPFVVTARLANPLVVWPAVEFYLPSIPLFGALSLGTVVTGALLAGLVGVNVVLGSRAGEADGDDAPTSSWGIVGGLATTGATACCCCAPAFYGVVGAVAGTAATPLYWAFMDPASPLASLFFVAATMLLTASTVHLSSAMEDGDACRRSATPRERG